MIVGDVGSGKVEQYKVGEAMEHYALNTPDDPLDTEDWIQFVIMLGDNFYPDSVDSPQWDLQFENVYEPSVLNMPFYVIFGNHDYIGSIQAQLDYVSPNGDPSPPGRWRIDANYYSFSYPIPGGSDEVDFFLLDTVTLLAGDPAQLAWLDAGLAASTARWVIVAGHYPIYSNGLHGGDPELEEMLGPVLADRADLYICGHEHDQQILSSVDGVFHIVNGTGGYARETGVRDNTIFAAGTPGFMAFLISHNDFVCRVIDQDNNVIYSIVLKSK